MIRIVATIMMSVMVALSVAGCGGAQICRRGWNLQCVLPNRGRGGYRTPEFRYHSPGRYKGFCDSASEKVGCDGFGAKAINGGASGSGKGRRTEGSLCNRHSGGHFAHRMSVLQRGGNPGGRRSGWPGGSEAV